MRVRVQIAHIARLLPAVLLAAVPGSPAWGDRFTYLDADGQSVVVEARLAGSGKGAHALELPDGQMLLIPQAAVLKRDVAPDPEPATAEVVIRSLEEKFTSERFRAAEDEPFVVCLILSAPLSPDDEARARGFLRKTGGFMNRVQGVFLRFARKAQIPTTPARFPLVVLVFESDDDFEQYARDVVGDQGFTTENLSGFYSGLTNYLAVQMSECHTYELPLHEAIHQQVYNRGVFQRLAPIPAWLNEGMATGFAGTGERINSGPHQINPRYAQMALQATRLDWSDVIAGDRGFRGDVLVGEAYAQAWSLHWMLVTRYKNAYAEYVRSLAHKQTLEEAPAAERVREFEGAFGKSIAQLQAQFPTALRAGAKRQGVPRPRSNTPGQSFTESQFAEVRLKAVKRLDQNGSLLVGGTLRNVSPLRALAFHVTVQTDAGTYAEWYVPELSTHESTLLDEQFVQKLMKNGRGGTSDSFRVVVRSAAPASEEAQRWKQGQLPVPVFTR